MFGHWIQIQILHQQKWTKVHGKIHWSTINKKNIRIYIQFTDHFRGAPNRGISSLFLGRVGRVSHTVILSADEIHGNQKDTKKPQIKAFLLFFLVEGSSCDSSTCGPIPVDWLRDSGVSWHQEPRQRLGPTWLQSCSFSGWFLSLGSDIMARARKPPSKCGTSATRRFIQGQLFVLDNHASWMKLLDWKTSSCQGVLDSGILKRFTLPGCHGSLGRNRFLETSSSRVAIYSLKRPKSVLEKTGPRNCSLIWQTKATGSSSV